MFVFISWLSLFIPAEHVPGRMALCVTTLLTLVTMFSSIRSFSPTTAYLKTTDIWMCGCLFTVFIILSEYCLVLYARKISQTSTSGDKNGNKKALAWKVYIHIKTCRKGIIWFMFFYNLSWVFMFPPFSSFTFEYIFPPNF